jgi:hydrogenase maturation protease
MRILIAGMGNALCTDDGFGVAVANALASRPLAPGVNVIEVGIGGIHLVHELLSGYDALVIVDAVDHGAPPGTLLVLQPEVPVWDELDPSQRHEILAETHYTVPSRALLLAKALGALPDRVLIVGCQGEAVDELGLELSAAVRAAVPRAIETIEGIVGELSGGSSPSLTRSHHDGP